VSDRQPDGTDDADGADVADSANGADDTTAADDADAFEGANASDDADAPDGAHAPDGADALDGAHAPDGADVADPDLDSEATSPSVYVESTIIMTTVRVVAPFVLTFGLFVMLHGADSPGGGFQGGVVVGAVVMMLAFAYGTDATQAWADRRIVTALATGGVLTFAAIGLGSIVLEGTFLEYHAYGFEGASKYGIELVELGIGAIVAGVVVSLFFQLSTGLQPEEQAGGGAGEPGGEEA